MVTVSSNTLGRYCTNAAYLAGLHPHTIINDDHGLGYEDMIVTYLAQGALTFLSAWLAHCVSPKLSNTWLLAGAGLVGLIDALDSRLSHTSSFSDSDSPITVAGFFFLKGTLRVMTLTGLGHAVSRGSLSPFLTIFGVVPVGLALAEDARYTLSGEHQ